MGEEDDDPTYLHLSIALHWSKFGRESCSIRRVDEFQATTDAVAGRNLLFVILIDTMLGACANFSPSDQSMFVTKPQQPVSLVM